MLLRGLSNSFSPRFTQVGSSLCRFQNSRAAFPRYFFDLIPTHIEGVFFGQRVDDLFGALDLSLGDGVELRAIE